MRVCLPFTVVCMGLLATSLVATGYDSGYGGDYNRAIDLQRSIRIVAKQKEALRAQVTMLQRQKTRMTKRLERVASSIIPDLEGKQGALDSRLVEIVKELKEKMHAVDNLTAAVAGEKAVAIRQEAMINPRWNQLLVLADSNTQQAAQIAKINTTLIESMRILDDKLASARTVGTSKINEVIENTKSAAEYVNTRHCFFTTVVVDVLNNGTGVTKVDYPEGYFPDRVPTSYCALKGFETNVDLGKSYAYGYEAERRGVGIKVTCKSLARSVLVAVFDNCEGEGNAVRRAHVTVRACSFGPQSSFNSLEGLWR